MPNPPVQNEFFQTQPADSNPLGESESNPAADAGTNNAPTAEGNAAQDATAANTNNQTTENNADAKADSTGDGKGETKAMHESGTTNPKDGSHIDVDVEAIELSFFFDGTWNNRNNSWTYNVKAREENPDPKDMEKWNDKKYNPKWLGMVGSTSYDRAPTGLDILEQAYKKDVPNNCSFYTEGTGTVNNKGDNAIGAGAGWFSTGLEAKTKRGFRQLEEFAKTHRDKLQKLALITVNAYGFSRGATSARSFCHRLLQKPKPQSIQDQYSNQNPELVFLEKIKAILAIQHTPSIQLKFVGLFDTVASVGFTHGNDTQKHDLDFQNVGLVEQDGGIQNVKFDKKNMATRVVQLGAADEFRHVFSRTNIKSAIEQGYGFEAILPGCHTDIGDGLGTAGKPATNPNDEKSNPVWYVHAKDDLRLLLQKTPSDIDYSDSKANDGSHNFQGSHKTNVLFSFSNAANERRRIAFDGFIQYLMNKGWYDRITPRQLPMKNMFNTKAMVAKEDLGPRPGPMFPPAPPPPAAPEQKNAQKGSKAKEEEPPKFQEVAANTAPLGLYHVTMLAKRQSDNVEYLYGRRDQISLDYPKIPTYIMTELMQKYSAYFLDEGILEKLYKKPSEADWQALYADLSAQVKQHEADTSLKTEIVLTVQDPALSKRMYNRYLHWSDNIASSSFVHRAQIGADGLPIRTVHDG